MLTYPSQKCLFFINVININIVTNISILVKLSDTKTFSQYCQNKKISKELFSSKNWFPFSCNDRVVLKVFFLEFCLIVWGYILDGIIPGLKKKIPSSKNTLPQRTYSIMSLTQNMNGKTQLKQTRVDTKHTKPVFTCPNLTRTRCGIWNCQLGKLASVDK